MKKIYILIIGIMILSLSACGKDNVSKKQTNDEEQMAKLYFNIDINEYDEVIVTQNTISDTEYDGSLRINLKIKKNQMEKFISDIEDANYFYWDINNEEISEDIRDTFYYIIEGISGRNGREAYRFHQYMGPPKKYIDDAKGQLLTAGGFIAFFENEEGGYDIYMEYCN